MGTPEENRDAFTWGCVFVVVVVGLLVVFAFRHVLAILLTTWAGLF